MQWPLELQCFRQVVEGLRWAAITSFRLGCGCGKGSRFTAPPSLARHGMVACLWLAVDCTALN